VRQLTALRAYAAAALVVLAAFGGCDSAPTDPDAVFSLGVEPLPFPAVVAGDTLRDRNGVAAPVTAVAYDGSGDPIPDAPIEFFSPDDDVTIEDGILVAGGEPGRSVRVYARIAGLTMEVTSRSQLQVVQAPVLLETSGEVPDSVSYEAPSIRSEPITVLLSSAPETEGGAGDPVANWLVNYRIEFRGALLQPEDDRFRVVQPGGSGAEAAPDDTTDASGLAAREVVVLDASDIAAGESLVVIITASHSGSPVEGSPLELPLRLTPP